MITIDDKNLQLTEEQEKNIRLEIAVMLYEKADYFRNYRLDFLNWLIRMVCHSSTQCVPQNGFTKQSLYG